jgi:ABC-type spermidine/putrescine transport system permease subunit II
MTSTEDRLARMTFVLVPAVIVAVGCGLSLLPRGVVGETFTVLGVWLSFSLPVGVVVGHCALSEADLPVAGRS